MSFCQNLKNKTLRPIDSSNSRDILIIIKSDVYFKMTKKTRFSTRRSSSKHVEKRLSCHFKTHIILYDDQNVTRS